MLEDAYLLENSIKIMEIVVGNPERLMKSSFEIEKVKKEVKKMKSH